MSERREHWAHELRLAADLLQEKIEPSYPGEAAPIDLIREVAEWHEKEGRTNDDLHEEIYNITGAASENFGSWHRLEFGDQAEISTDVRAAYLAGHRYAHWEARKK